MRHTNRDTGAQFVNAVDDQNETVTVEAAKAGDARAYAALVRRSDRRMRALAYRLVRDRADMDDVLQVSYLKAFRALPSFRAEGGFESWLYAIVYRSCLDHLRRLGPPSVPLPDDGSLAADRSTGVDLATATAHRITIEEALDRLPLEQRAAVWLVDGEGHTFKQAAEILDLRPGTVASRVSRGRSALRALLESADPGPEPGPQATGGVA